MILAKGGSPMQDKQPTIYDVAELAGVSIATVSRAMSGGSISAKSRQKVESAIEKLNYHPSALHAHTQKKRRGTLAIVVGDMDNPYCAALCRGAEDEAQRSGYSLELYCHPTEFITCEQMIQRILAHKPDGIALTGGLVEDGTPEQILDNLNRLQREMPVVTIGPRIEGMPCINIASDSGEAVRKSMAHLINLGHRNISFIGGRRDVRFSEARTNAYYRAMAQIGVPAQDCLVYPTGFTPQSGEVGVAKLLASLEGKPLPTAILAINDVCALGAMRQLQRASLRVPEDIAIIGCDNLFFGQYLSPPLTTVDLRAEERGRSAMKELVHALSGGESILFDHKLECSLIVRESCGAMRSAPLYK